MNAGRMISKWARALPLAAGLFAGCETTDQGGASAGGVAYYGEGISDPGFYDPWYHGSYYPPEIIVTPPSDGWGRPEHPIANPPPAAAPSPRPLPSIPSAPRPAPRR